MDGRKIATALGAGLASGLIMLSAIHAAALPVSYVMNRYIYHGALMRIVIGFLGLLAFVPIFLMLMLNAATFGLLAPKIGGLFRSQHYFGLFPLSLTSDEAFTVTGWSAPLFRFFRWFAAPFQMKWDDGAYEEAASALLVDPSKNVVVNEQLFSAARDLGAIGRPGAWQAGIQALAAEVAPSQ